MKSRIQGHGRSLALAVPLMVAGVAACAHVPASSAGTASANACPWNRVFIRSPFG